MLVTQVGQAMLIGKEVRDGSFTSHDWLQQSVALLCFAVGFVRGAVHGDTPTSVVLDEDGARLAIPPGATDGFLWNHYTARSVMFVRQRFERDPYVDAELVADTIDKGRYPADPECERGSNADLLRASHIIGTAADPHFIHKLRRLLIERRESGLEESDSQADVARFREEYPRIFWRDFVPLLREGIALLKQTAEGRFWLAQMHAHVHAEEHRHEEHGAAS